MKLQKLPYNRTVCKVNRITDIDICSEIFFIGKTDEELSLVCKTEDTPVKTVERENGRRGFRICGVLDFSLIGILSEISGLLAENSIGIFAVSTYNTDYILVKEDCFEKTLRLWFLPAPQHECKYFLIL